MENTRFRWLGSMIGLSGLGAIVAELLKKWELVPQNFSLFWVIAFIWVLFAGREFTTSPYMEKLTQKSPDTARLIVRAVNVTHIVIAVLIFISIPFIWFGVIEELAHGVGPK